MNWGLFLFSIWDQLMVLLIEVCYNRFNTEFTIIQTRYIYRAPYYIRHYIQIQLTFTIHLRVDYNTDTLQDALIHTVLYAGATYIYNTSTGRLQYRYITGRPNTYVTLHFLHMHILGYSHFLFLLIWSWHFTFTQF